MGSLKINGINLNVNVSGEGQPLILIHGIGGDQTQLANVPEKLSKIFKVITFDCRGHGESDKPAGYTLNDHVADVLDIMDYYGIQTAFLDGISMGSYIAQAVAITAPQRVSKLILTVPKSNGLTSSIQRLITENSRELAGLDQHGRILALLKYLTYDADMMKKHIDIFETRLTPEQFYHANKAVSGFDFRADLHKIQAKTLVISGKYDNLNPPAEGQLCASLIPGALFVEMQYSGHAPMYEEPETYIRIVKDFLMS